MKVKLLSPKLVQLVKLLADGKRHDGDYLGKELGVTRNAVWKMMKKLELYEVLIHAVKGKGYALSEPFIMLDSHVIKACLPENVELMVLESVHSTNDYLKSTHKKNIQICLAEQQTEGRGRLNRTWHSPFGKNLYLSCYYPFQNDISELSGLSLVIGLSIVAALQALGLKDHVCVKWPNDVLCHQKKLAGILIDLQAESHGECDVIVGIGLNVNMVEPKDTRTIPIDQSWTSLSEEFNIQIDRNQVATILIHHLLDYMARFKQYGFRAFMDEWMSVDSLIKKDIKIMNVHHEVTGQYAGINEQGHLLLQTSEGDIRAFSSGEVLGVKK